MKNNWKQFPSYMQVLNFSFYLVHFLFSSIPYFLCDLKNICQKFFWLRLSEPHQQALFGVKLHLFVLKWTSLGREGARPARPCRQQMFVGLKKNGLWCAATLVGVPLKRWNSKVDHGDRPPPCNVEGMWENMRGQAKIHYRLAVERRAVGVKMTLFTLTRCRCQRRWLTSAL